MPEHERTVIVLAYQDELSQAEIAGRLGISVTEIPTVYLDAVEWSREQVGMAE